MAPRNAASVAANSSLSCVGETSRATSMTSTAQQLSVSMGVALGATLLHLTLLWHGTSELTATDFWPAFVAIALISSSSVFVYARLAPDAGAEVSGRMLIAPTPPVPKE